MQKFKMVYLKDVKLFLGIRITRSKDQITLDQTAYIKTISNSFRMNDCKPAQTPLESKLNFEALNLDINCNAPCRNLVGCLMYVMLCTRI